LDGIDLDVKVWDVDSVLCFIEHGKRVKDANLDFPVILSSTGFICDGWHRVVSAIIKGKETIRAIRMDDMPEPSNIVILK